MGLQTSANRTFKKANDWFKANGLKLNTGKTQLVQFGTKRVTCEVKINDAEEITNCQSAKFLGVVIDQNLNWKAHVKHLQSKLSSASYALRVISTSTSQHVVLTAYYAYIYPHLRYGVVFWGNSAHSAKIFKLQKTCIRIICNLPFRAPCKSYFKGMGILTLPSLYMYEVLRMCRRGLSGADKYEGGYLLRNAPLRYPAHRLTLLERGPRYSGIRLYNALPRHVRDEVSDVKFAKLLKDILINGAYYTVNEFLNDHTD